MKREALISLEAQPRGSKEARFTPVLWFSYTAIPHSLAEPSLAQFVRRSHLATPLPSYISCSGISAAHCITLPWCLVKSAYNTYSAHLAFSPYIVDACPSDKMSSSKNVKFSKDSDTSGSRTSSHASSHVSSHASQKSSRGHRRSDSESLSDYDSRGPVPEGAFSSADYAQQQLRKALHTACAERDRWKDKAHELDEDLANTRKEYNQLEARWRGIIERNEVIEQEKKKLHSEKKALQEDKKALLDENEQLKERLEKLEKKLNRASGTPPSSSINLNNPEKPKIHRSNSRSQRDAPRERALSQAEQAEKDKARLSKRFERSDESSDGRSDSTSKTERRRRRESTTYVEPMGPPAARPVAPVPPSPTRHFQTYTTSPAYAPQYANVREPAMSSVPRSVKSPSKHPATIHPSVLVQSPQYHESPFHHPDEDGGYFPHPLPRDRGR